jgi:hypothetical protein
VSRSSRPPFSAVGEGEIRALLDRYRCPVPFHAVRTRFLGDIASSVMSASPLDAVKALWGGELPAFDSLDAVNELLRILIVGLWNRLSRHQERSAPFRLVRVEIPESRGGLAHIALIRREELDGFVEGGCSEKSKASNFRSEPIAPSTHSQSCARYLTGLHELGGNPTKPVTVDDIAQTRRNIRELTKVGEREIHEVVLSCTRARRQLLNSVPTTKPTHH